MTELARLTMLAARSRPSWAVVELPRNTLVFNGRRPELYDWLDEHAGDSSNWNTRAWELYGATHTEIVFLIRDHTIAVMFKLRFSP